VPPENWICWAIPESAQIWREKKDGAMIKVELLPNADDRFPEQCNGSTLTIVGNTRQPKSQ
jgi:hypothetical protein